MKQMYKAQNGSPSTMLALPIAAESTKLFVEDGSILPDAPTLLVIGTDPSCEVVLCTEKDGNSLAVERGFYGTTPQEWLNGTEVCRAYTAYDHDAFLENIIALGTDIADTKKKIEAMGQTTGIHIGEEAPTDGSEVWIDTDEEAASGGGASIDVTAEVGQTIVVKEVDENGKPTKWESADYQQRTHYENGTKANTLLNCNVPITNNQYAELGVLGFEDGHTYKVSWNGTEYVCVSVTVPYDQTTTAITIGNLGLMGGTNTGEPFLIGQLDNGFIAFASVADGTFSVKITEEVPSYKTIDEYYLPNRAKTYVLTANDYELNQAFVQNVEIESAHLANKLLDLLWNGYDILIDFSDISLSPPMVCQAKVLGWFYFENSLQLMFAVASDTRHITIKGGTWTPPTT